VVSLGTNTRLWQTGKRGLDRTGKFGPVAEAAAGTEIRADDEPALEVSRKPSSSDPEERPFL